jgi:hypothetical protein
MHNSEGMQIPSFKNSELYNVNNINRLAMIDECNALISRIESEPENTKVFKEKIKELMIQSLLYNQDILSYGTKSYFIKAIGRWRQNASTGGNVWFIPCLTDVKYTFMFINERPMIHAVDDLINDFTYDQILAEVHLLQ